MVEPSPQIAPRATYVATEYAQGGYVEWGPIVAGAVSTLAVSFVLLAFGAAVGLAAVSPWTITPSAVTAVGVGSAFWILIVSLWSFALGGYISGRMRHAWSAGAKSEIEFRDNAHGLVTWATAVVLAGVIAAITASAPGRVSVSTDSPIVASAVDKITRTTKPDRPAADLALRSEVARTLTANLKTTAMESGDATYLAAIAADRGGLAPPDAAKRVADAFSEMKSSMDHARKAGVVMGFLVAATLLIGAATAWWAAGVGGEHRDQATVWHAFGRYGPKQKASFLGAGLNFWS